MPFDNPPQTPFGDVGLLADARSRIAEDGDWLKDRFQDGNRRCLVGALSLVAGSRSFDAPNRVERRLARRLAEQLPPQFAGWVAKMKFVTSRHRLIWFNDDPGTRHEDVIALFDRAIDHLTIKAPVCVSM